MVQQKIEITNSSGLHLRPAGLLCKEAMKFKCQVTFLFDDSIVNAKSVLSVLGACVKCGDQIVLRCEGQDENEALSSLSNIIQKGLGE